MELTTHVILVVNMLYQPKSPAIAYQILRNWLHDYLCPNLNGILPQLMVRSTRSFVRHIGEIMISLINTHDHYASLTEQRDYRISYIELITRIDDLRQSMMNHAIVDFLDSENIAAETSTDHATPTPTLTSAFILS